MGLVGAFVAGWLLAPSPVAAGCGDYVTDRGQPAGHNPALALSADRPDLPRHPPARRDCPCSGPRCSKAPLLPAAPVAPAFEAGQEWGYVAGQPPFVANGPDVVFAEDSAARPMRRLAVTYRPPR